MLWEEVERYEEITGESAEKVTISRIGGFLDGYEKAMEVVKRDENMKKYFFRPHRGGLIHTQKTGRKHTSGDMIL